MAKQDILKTKEEKYLDTMEELQYIWDENYKELRTLHTKGLGIRSSQIGALVMLLIEKGILK